MPDPIVRANEDQDKEEKAREAIRRDLKCQEDAYNLLAKACADFMATRANLGRSDWAYSIISLYGAIERLMIEADILTAVEADLEATPDARTYCPHCNRFLDTDTEKDGKCKVCGFDGNVEA